jgi:phosphoribosyl 1,2-cyclic phosphate phosphodiesterase
MSRQKVPVWADEMTGQMLTARFPYCFYTAPGGDYPPIASLNRMAPGVPVTVGGAGGDITALPIRLQHGTIDALGFRLGNVAYSPDVNGIPEDSQDALTGLDLWVVDALKRTPHPSHFSLSDTLRWIERLRPRRAILTNMHVDMDYDTLRRELPDHIEPAYDGMVFEV